MGRAWQEEGEKQRGMKKRVGETEQRRHGGERTREEAEMTKKWRQARGGWRGWGRGGGDEDEAEGRGKEIGKRKEGEKRNGRGLIWDFSEAWSLGSPSPTCWSFPEETELEGGPGGLMGWAGGSPAVEGNRLDSGASRLE